MHKKSQRLLNFWWLPFIGFCILAYWIQQNIRIMHDVAIATTVSFQMFDGQTYAKDIFDPNPPMIFYLLMPAVLMTKYLSIPSLSALHVYLILLIAISTTCSFFLLKKILRRTDNSHSCSTSRGLTAGSRDLIQNNELKIQLNDGQCTNKKLSMDPAVKPRDVETSNCLQPLYENAWLTGLMTMALAIIFLFLPVEMFGQREHVYLILTMPYLLLAVARLENIPIHKTWAILIGIMAGLGFAIKPFFLPTLGLIELLFIYRSRRFLGWVRPESVIVCTIIVLYFLSIIIFYPSYWNTVLPMWMPFYKAIVQPWSMVLLSPYFIFCCVVLGFAIYTRKNTAHTTLKTVLYLAITGGLISYLVPRVSWYYHILPAFSMAFLYCILIIGELLESMQTHFKRAIEWISIGFLVLVILSLPFSRIVYGTKVAIDDFHEDASLNHLITYVNEHKNIQSFVSFSIIHRLYVLEYYTNIKQVGSFSFFVWEWEPTLLPSKSAKIAREKTMPYAMDVIARDLNDKKPQWVIVDSSAAPRYFDTQIDYVTTYSKYPVFKNAFSHYAHIKTIGPYLIYERASL